MKPGAALREDADAGLGGQGCLRSGSSENQIKKEDTLVLMLCRCLPHALVFDFRTIHFVLS